MHLFFQQESQGSQVKALDRVSVNNYSLKTPESDWEPKCHLDSDSDFDLQSTFDSDSGFDLDLNDLNLDTDSKEIFIKSLLMPSTILEASDYPHYELL